MQLDGVYERGCMCYHESRTPMVDVIRNKGVKQRQRPGCIEMGPGVPVLSSAVLRRQAACQHGVVSHTEPQVSGHWLHTSGADAE